MVCLGWSVSVWRRVGDERNISVRGGKEWRLIPFVTDLELFCLSLLLLDMLQYL